MSRLKQIALVLAVFVCACSAAKREVPKAHRGELDLRAWDLEKDGPVSLDGEWSFYWREKISGKQSPLALSHNTRPEFINVPGSWNTLVGRRQSAEARTGHGFATLHLQLKLPLRKGLRLFNLWTGNSFILYCGERLLAQTGQFAEHAAAAVPLHLPTLVSLDQCESTDLFWQIANFETYFGGPRNGWRLGTDALLAEELLYRDFFVAGFVALAGFFGISCLIAWLLKRNLWHYLIFAALSLVAILIRLAGEKLIQRFVSKNVFDPQIRLEYVAAAWSGVLIFWALYAQFPRYVSRYLTVFISLPVVAATFLTLSAPLADLTRTVPLLLIYLIALLLLSMTHLVFLFLKKVKNSGVFLVAVVAFVIAACHDILVLMGALSNPRYSGVGYIALLLAQSVLTIRTFLHSTHESRMVQGKLAEDLAEQLAVTDRQNALLAAAADMWIINDPHDFGKIKDASLRACRSLGYSLEELRTLHVNDIEVEFPVSTRTQWEQHLEEIRAVSGSLNIQGAWRRKNGTTFPVSVTVSLHRFQGKEYLVGIGRDMTPEVESGRALRRSEEKFQDFYRNNLLILLILNNDGSIFDANPAAINQLEYSADEFLHRPMCDFVLPEDCAMARGYFENYLKSPLNAIPLEYRLVCKSGRILWVSQSLQFLRGNNGPDKVLVSCRNISKRKEAEKALYESEAQMRLITEAIPGPVSHIGRDGTYVFVNRHYEEWFGDKREVVIGKKPEQVLRPELFTAVEPYFAQVRTGKEVTWETTIKPADGKERAVQITHIPDFDLNGKVAGIFTIVYDISTRKYAEDTLRNSLEEKDMLLAEIHHRVKNNLQVISSLISMQSRLISDSTAQTHLESLGLRIRAMGLLHNILYKSIGTGKVDMNVYLTSIAEQVMSVQRQVAEKIPMEFQIQSIQLNIETALPIGLIVNEAVSNSFKYAFAQNNTPLLHLSLTEDKSEYRLVIADNGPGMPPKARKDTTLGLRLIETLVRQLHGHMVMETSEGVCFRISFAEQKKEQNRWQRVFSPRPQPEEKFAGTKPEEKNG